MSRKGLEEYNTKLQGMLEEAKAAAAALKVELEERKIELAKAQVSYSTFLL